MFVYNSALNKAKSLKEGDMVSWNSSGGRATGKVVHVMDYGTLDIPNTKFKIKGEKDNPAVLIQLYRDGKETDIQVGHKMSSLTKSLDEQLLKHGSHNQQSHAGSRGGGAGGSSTTKPQAPKSAPSSLIGKIKVDNAINKIPKEKKDSAYRSGWMMGANTDSKSEAGNKLWRDANSWVKDTIAAIENDNKTLDEGTLVETVRAVGLINGTLYSGRPSK